MSTKKHSQKSPKETGAKAPTTDDVVTTALTATSPALHPEFYPLPSRGLDCLGCSRSFLYQLDKAGEIRLLRVRLPGRVNAKILVPFRQVRDALIRLGTAQQKEGAA